VLHFRPTRWDRWSQQLEVTVGELLPDQPVPLLKRRLELRREEALKLWAEKRKAGWARFDIGLVPFPFTDGPNVKPRPAMVIGLSERHQDVLLAFISSKVTGAASGDELDLPASTIHPERPVSLVTVPAEPHDHPGDATCS